MKRREFLRAAGVGACGALGCVLASGAPRPVGLYAAEDGAGRDQYYKEAMYYEKLPDGRIQCLVCPRKCVVGDTGRGFCRVRENVGGKYCTVVYGRVCTYHVDPIEKKPLFHFLPGTSAFSLATVGCNLECKFCQNWEISQEKPENLPATDMPPAKVVESAVRLKTPTIAYTYTEPTVYYEFMLDTARKGREEGLRNVMISAGYINPDPLVGLTRAMDAIKIDLKGFTPDFYANTCNATLPPVLDSIAMVKKSGTWIEIVHLVIPTLNDSDKETDALCKWLHENVGDEVPLHFTRFYPTYKLANLPPTSVAAVERAREIGLARGLKYVYVGNVPAKHPGESTYCPKCGKIVIERAGYTILSNRLRAGKCSGCNASVAGVWSQAALDTRLGPVVASTSAMKPQARDAIDLERAQTLVIGKVDVLAPEEIRLEDAVGRVLRGQVVSDVDYPSEDVSAMDGYAMAASSTEGASCARPVELRLVGSVRAGETPSVTVGPGECVAITTGAVLPQGSDAVAKHEEVETRLGAVVLDRPVARHAFVRRRGEVLAMGARLDVDGWRVTPATAGLLAAAGAGRVVAVRQPRVGVLTTGDEIVPYDTFPSPGRFRNSNGPMLAGLAAAIGCRVVGTSISGDSVPDLVRNLEAYSDCDAVLVSGGVSDGEFDLVTRALETLGAEIAFDAVRMSPGKRVVFAKRDRTSFFGVPGNPGAALVAFMMIARPGLLKMMGLREVLPAVFRARTTGEIDKARGFVKLVPGLLKRAGSRQASGADAGAEAVSDGGPHGGPDAGPDAEAHVAVDVEPLGSRGRGDVIALARADCLVYLGPDRGSVAAREIVDVFML